MAATQTDGAVDLVTIVIPVFNGADYLAQAIDSALAQTWHAVEVLVVDDGSEDAGRTRAIAESYGDRIHLLCRPHGGVAAALNAGIAAMRGAWFSWLSHDDVYDPRKIEMQLNALRAASPGTLAFSDYATMDAEGSLLRIEHATCGFDASRRLWSVLEGKINGCTLLIPRHLLVEAGGFDIRLPTTQDYELWFRLVRRNPLIAVPGVVVRQRMHDGQGSRTRRHLDEAGLLWREMLESLAPAEMRQLAGSEAAFRVRMARHLATSPYPAAAATAAELLWAELGRIKATLVWTAAQTPGPERMLAALRETGLRDIACVIADYSVEASASLALRASAPVNAMQIRLRPGDGLFSLLEATQAAGDEGFVLLADRTSSTASEQWRRGIEEVLAGYCDGWLQANAQTGGVLPRALNGAILSRAAVQATLDRCAALGHADAESTLGLVARLGYSCVPTHGNAVQDASAASPPRPKLAETFLGARLLDAIGLVRQRFPAVYTRCVGAVPRLFGARDLVDGVAYLAANHDVAVAGFDPLHHYLRHGWREGRSPRPPLQPDINDWSPPRAAEIATGATARLLVLHACGGGTLRYAELVANVLRRQGIRPIFAWGSDGRELCISSSDPSRADSRHSLPEGIDDVAKLLHRLRVTRVDVLHSLGVEESLPKLLRALAVPYDVTLLDYHLFAHEPHLMRGDGLTPARNQGDELSALRPLLRSGVHPLLQGASRIVACSRDLTARLLRLAPDLRIRAVRPPEPLRAEAFRVTPPVALERGEALRVLVLGHLVRAKGSQELLAVATQAKQRDLCLEFHHLGVQIDKMAPREQACAALRLHGFFRREDLTTIVNRIRPHLAWFPARAPETWGFTLSEAMSMGLPILARGVGAYPERLAGRAFTWVVRAEEQSPEFWLERMIALRDSALALPSEAAMPSGLPTLLDDYYDRDYV